MLYINKLKSSLYFSHIKAYLKGYIKKCISGFFLEYLFGESRQSLYLCPRKAAQVLIGKLIKSIQLSGVSALCQWRAAPFIGKFYARRITKASMLQILLSGVSSRPECGFLFQHFQFLFIIAPAFSSKRKYWGHCFILYFTLPSISPNNLFRLSQKEKKTLSSLKIKFTISFKNWKIKVQFVFEYELNLKRR